MTTLTGPYLKLDNRNRYLTAALNAALILLLAYVLAQITWQVIPAPSLDHIPMTLAPDKTPATAANRFNERSIASVHLFGTADKTVMPRKAYTSKAPPTRLQLTLRGIVATDDAGAALAIIQNKKQNERHFATGDSIFGLATLEKIYVDRVILLHDGRYETLRLPKESLQGVSPAKTTRKRQQISSAEYVKSMRGEMKKIHKMTLEKMSHPWQYIYFEPAVENGKTVGIKVTAEEEREFLNKHGLRLGDIITSINGKELAGGAMATAMGELTEDAAIDFIVKRGEQTLYVHIDTKDE